MIRETKLLSFRRKSIYIMYVRCLCNSQSVRSAVNQACLRCRRVVLPIYFAGLPPIIKIDSAKCALDVSMRLYSITLWSTIRLNSSMKLNQRHMSRESVRSPDEIEIQ